MRGLTRRLWPRSLKGQVLLALALALFLAQSLSAALLWKGQAERREEGLVTALALRLTMANRHADDHTDDHGPDGLGPPPPEDHGPEDRGPDGRAPYAHPADDRGPGDHPVGGGPNMPRGLRTQLLPSYAPPPGDLPMPELQSRLTRILADQDITPRQLLVLRHPLAHDAGMRRALRHRPHLLNDGPPPDFVLVGALQRGDGRWLVVRVLSPAPDPWIVGSLIAQTLLIYAILVGTMALILRRITRPLAALTARLEAFTRQRDAQGCLTPQGPQDLRRLIEAHNAMEASIIALLNEKDVMLGAIGHDLKTPLAALRVRIESVEDEAERLRMAQTIDDIARSLDDMLSLARVGRPSDPIETTELAALVASVVEEYEDMGEPVELGETTRLPLPLRATWLRRALRNLVSNALRYAGSARVSLERVDGWAQITIEDDGPGIPEGEIDRMMEPFTRGEPSRNLATGGAGLGLTLARAIAQQHGGTLTLANRHDAAGQVTGLVAHLRLPLG